MPYEMGRSISVSNAVCSPLSQDAFKVITQVKFGLYLLSMQMRRSLSLSIIGRRYCSARKLISD